MEVGLQQMHNGRSGALHGYTSELLRYAKLVPTPEVPAPAHLLAPCLVVLFNAAFSIGQVPSVVEDLLEGGRHRHSQLWANLSGRIHRQALCQHHGTKPGQVH